MRTRDPPAAEVTDHLPGVAGLSSTTYNRGHRARDDIAAVLWLVIISLGVMLLLARNSLNIISVLLNGGLLFLVLHYGSAELQSIAAYGSSGFMLCPGFAEFLGTTSMPTARALLHVTRIPRVVWFALWLVTAVAAPWLGGHLLLI